MDTGSVSLPDIHKCLSIKNLNADIGPLSVEMWKTLWMVLFVICLIEMSLRWLEMINLFLKLFLAMEKTNGDILIFKLSCVRSTLGLRTQRTATLGAEWYNTHLFGVWFRWVGCVFCLSSGCSRALRWMSSPLVEGGPRSHFYKQHWHQVNISLQLPKNSLGWSRGCFFFRVEFIVF